MSTARMPSRDAMQRLTALTDQYRAAFGDVQDLLARSELGRIPSWVFAIDRLKIEEINALSPELAAAENRRRTLKIAMHALLEYIALEDDAPIDRDDPSTEEVANLVSSLEDRELDNARQLDRFITVVNYAKSGGCIFINGTFEPVVHSAAPGPQAPQRQPAPSGVPQGDDISLPEPDVQFDMPSKG